MVDEVRVTRSGGDGAAGPSRLPLYVATVTGGDVQQADHGARRHLMRRAGLPSPVFAHGADLPVVVHQGRSARAVERWAREVSQTTGLRVEVHQVDGLAAALWMGAGTAAVTGLLAMTSLAWMFVEGPSVVAIASFGALAAIESLGLLMAVRAYTLHRSIHEALARTQAAREACEAAPALWHELWTLAEEVATEETLADLAKHDLLDLVRTVEREAHEGELTADQVADLRTIVQARRAEAALGGTSPADEALRRARAAATADLAGRTR